MKSILPTTLTSALVGSLLLSASAFASDTEYTLLHPTPHDALRPLRSDSEDRVIGPYTVDAGHFQLEGDLVNYLTHSAHSDFPSGAHFDGTQDVYFWSPTLKVGLCNRADLEVNFSYATFHIDETFTTRSGGAAFHFSDSDDFWGSVVPKVKFNLWGNDGGTTALAVAPFLSIPTAGNMDVTGGIGLPFAANLPRDFSIKIYPELFFLDNGRDLDPGFNGNIALHKSLLNSKLDLFANFNSQVTDRFSLEWVGYTGFGAGYNITSNLQAYFGMRFGVTSNAFDYNPYLGLTWRY